MQLFDAALAPEGSTAAHFHITPWKQRLVPSAFSRTSGRHFSIDPYGWKSPTRRRTILLFTRAALSSSKALGKACSHLSPLHGQSPQKPPQYEFCIICRYAGLYYLALAWPDRYAACSPHEAGLEVSVPERGPAQRAAGAQGEVTPSLRSSAQRWRMGCFWAAMSWPATGKC